MISAFLKIIGATDSELAAGCKIYLESKGYLVEVRGKWETETQLCIRLKISDAKFRRRLKRWKPPLNGDIQRGPNGRMISIRSNPQLDRFLAAPCGAQHDVSVIEKDLAKIIKLPEGMVKAKTGVIVRGKSAKQKPS